MRPRIQSQRTLKKAVELKGVGLHGGQTARVRIAPAKPFSGIVFVRSDLEDRPMISAHYQNVVCTQLATTIGNQRIKVATVEHLVAALAGLDIDNAIIEVDGPEVPILDGSAGEFCRAILDAGIENQMMPRPEIHLHRRVEVSVQGKSAVAEPSNRLQIASTIKWDHPVIGEQTYHYDETESSFAEIADARTFGFLRDVEAMKRMGLARGGSLDNAIVLDQHKVLNPDGLRYKDEFVRHKLLDALGDLKLAGVCIKARFEFHCSGHELHSRLLKEIFKDPANYSVQERAPQEAQLAAV